jgi:hypothetical protein
VSALTTLTNVQNSLFVPDLGRWINRRPTYTLSSRQPSRRDTQTSRFPSVRRRPVERQPSTELLERFQTAPETSPEVSRVTSRVVTRVATVPSEPFPEVPGIAVIGATPQQSRADEEPDGETRAELEEDLVGRGRAASITSQLADEHYAVLPHGISLEGWSEEDKIALDDHVRHMLHSKRSKFKQTMKAFGKYISKREYS